MRLAGETDVYVSLGVVVTLKRAGDDEVDVEVVRRCR